MAGSQMQETSTEPEIDPRSCASAPRSSKKPVSPAPAEEGGHAQRWLDPRENITQPRDAVIHAPSCLIWHLHACMHRGKASRLESRRPCLISFGPSLACLHIASRVGSCEGIWHSHTACCKYGRQGAPALLRWPSVLVVCYLHRYTVCAGV